MDRYLIREIVGPLALGFLVYTFILLLNFLFRSAEMIIRRGLEVSVVGQLLLTTLPNIVVLTIPMAMLFGILIAVGRLSADSELTALRSCGVSLMTLYRPILYVSAFLTLCNVLLMVYALPWGNRALQELRFEIATTSVAQQVEPRVFYEDWDELVLYVFETPEGDDRWRGVFLAESLPSTFENQVTVAEWGRLEVDEEGDRVILSLEDANSHKVNLQEPENYEITHHDDLEIVVEDSFLAEQREKVSISRSLRELTIPELVERMHDPGASTEARNLALVEIHKKFAIPFACIVFGLIALPLGFNTRRGGKGSGFALSIFVILVYYILLSNGEEAARFGKIPAWLAMWFPNFALATVGILLLVRRNRDKSLLLARVDRWMRGDLWGLLLRFRRGLEKRRGRRREKRRRRRQERRGFRVGLPRLRLRFPNLLDRYVMMSFAQVFGLVLLSGISIYIIADLSENVDEIMRSNAPTSVFLDYYKYLSLQIFYDIAPVLVLITTLITFSLLSRTNEVTAVKALGISLYRLALPALAMAALVVVVSVFFQSEVLPAANQRIAQLKDQIEGREAPRTYRRADRQWLFGNGRYVYNFLHFDPRNESLQRLQVFEFTGDYELARRLFTSRATYVGPEENARGETREGPEGSRGRSASGVREEGAWLFRDGWIRSFEEDRQLGFDRFDRVLIDYPETPEYFDTEVLPPEQLPYFELKRYIEDLEESGQKALELEVQLYNKIAFPMVSLVMALVGLPFAFRLGRQGALYGIGVSVVVGIVFMGVFAFFTTMGEAGALPPAVAVWSPGVIFGLLSLYLFLGIRT